MTALGAYAQSNHVDYSTIKISDWVTQKSNILDYSFDEYGSKQAFMLSRKVADSKSASLAYPKNLDFTNGSIELDIAPPNGKNGFVGIAFHIQGKRTF
jgi:hypothetical protein